MSKKELLLATLWAMYVLVALSVSGCHRVHTDAQPVRCGVEAPRYPDDDSGDMGYIPEPGEVCRAS